MPTGKAIGNVVASAIGIPISEVTSATGNRAAKSGGVTIIIAIAM
ncbi:hypothetical protein NJB18001_44240 [Mycobacterium marinum]|nr:hypothetical protein KST_03852 [Mycobacterium marinum]GJP11673.1 hypothetical protein NJB18001_44240 [Mycobacterium marinum]